MYRTVIRMFRSYDVNSLYETCVSEWQEDQSMFELEKKKMNKILENNFYAQGRVEEKI